YCWLCQIECCITIEGHERLFSVTQECQSCGFHKQWRSHPTPAGEAVGAFKIENKQQEEIIQEDHEDEDAPTYPEKEQSSEPGGEDEDEEERQDSSDEWEPRLDDMAADADISMDEDLFSYLIEDSKGKVVVWCEVCRTDAMLSCSVSRHKKVYACAQCGAGDHIEMRNFENLVVHFNDFTSFQKHAEKKHEAKPFHKPCQECGKFILAEPTSMGRKDHKCEKIKHIVCPECGKRFLTEIGLKRHFSKLHKDADHPCKYCLKLFKNRPSKLEHEQTHPKEKEPYSCPDCLERFDNIHKRNSHLKLHRGPYKYACDTCGKRFRDIIMLKRHKLIHSGEKPFRCHVCDRSFNQIGNLSSHMRLHTGEKPFMCEQCGECFNHNVSLKNHLLRQMKCKIY
uniref:C2H2-type domain-containing protein n=1 Tax=Astyanax mexicanus TaxID=7994 RepID=A0A8B9HYJ0_ASTMX